YPRPGYESSSALFENADLTILNDAPQVEISATAIRCDIKENRSVRALLPPQVLDYIDKKGLYK
ncbi:MAG: nicotinic acid mononucleotide adenylyltransferase, partial [Flavobacteriales bacterium]|nr:nicotinic acid mononucleotide adenylyltransferase [Flavobacteriales bacterium]